MIRLERDRTKVPPEFIGGQRIQQLLKLLVLNAKGKRVFESKYWKKAKDQLRAESSGKCAYCEATAATVAHCDVEHFRPKDHYWWLAYCYDNYLFACQLCNQSYKKAKFPLLLEAAKLSGPEPLPAATDAEAIKKQFVASICPDPMDNAAIQATEAQWDAEGPLLVNPYLHKPEELFDWVALPINGTNNGTVEIAPKPGNALANEFFKAIYQYYGINRDEIRFDRWKTYRPLKAMSRTILSGALATYPAVEKESKDTLKAMMAPSAPYAAMCRFFLKEWNLNLDT